MVKREIESTPELVVTTYDSATSPTQTRSAAATPSKKSKASPRKPKTEDEQEQHGTARAGQTQQTWSADEEAAFIEIVDKIVKESIWKYAKEDERIAHRGNTGVKAQWTAVMNKLKRSI